MFSSHRIHTTTATTTHYCRSDNNISPTRPPTMTARKRWSSSDIGSLSNEVTLLALERNDPLLTDLCIGLGHSHKNAMMQRAGIAIGGSTSLKHLRIGVTNDDEEDLGWLDAICRGLVRNRSIEFLTITVSEEYYDDDDCLDIFAILAPFFKNNDRLRGLEVPRFTAKMFDSLSLALSTCKNNRLEFFYLGVEYEDEVNVEEESAVRFFCSLNPNCLLELEMYNIDIPPMAHSALANLLKNPSSQIHNLVLYGTSLGGDPIGSLSNAIDGNNTLRSLNLGKVCHDVSLRGWNALSNIISHPKCSIERLSLGENAIDDAIASVLGSALSTNESVKYLDLTGNPNITSVGWKHICRCWRNLEEVDLCGCTIDDNDFKAILSALADSDNVSLRNLGLLANPISSTGLIAFIHALRRCKNLALERLDLRGSDHILVNELPRGDSLVFTRTLCDWTSIDGIYYSNHVFHSLFLDQMNPFCREWRVIHYSLALNKNPNKAQVARQKIMMIYFTGEDGEIFIFAEMHENVLPTALEWIGRDEIGFSLMYDVVRSLPTLFDVSNNNVSHKGSNKRSRIR